MSKLILIYAGFGMCTSLAIEDALHAHTDWIWEMLTSDAIAFGLVYFCLRRTKRDNQGRIIDREVYKFIKTATISFLAGFVPGLLSLI